MLRGSAVAVFVLAMTLAAGTAYGDVVYFSGALSDDDDPILSHFQAHVVWEYSNLDQLLTLTIYNETSTPFGYTLSQLNFNTSDAVTGLSLITNPADPLYNGDFPGASLVANPPAQGGFGSFDWGLDLGSGNTGLLHGESTTFFILVTGDGLANEDFFGGAGSAVVHFASGPQPSSDEDSVWGLAYGATPPPITVIPEPASLILLSLGLVGIVLHRGRKARA
jgi:hypothetical protein